jgi:outer membrane receptor for monomeric catechols
MAEAGRIKPTRRTHRRSTVQGRDQANQTRRLIAPSPTFGHSSTHRAVTMYLRHGGATNEDIIKENGGPYLNCLTKIKAMGHKIEKQKIVNNRGNLVTSYRIILK